MIPDIDGFLTDFVQFINDSKSKPAKEPDLAKLNKLIKQLSNKLNELISIPKEQSHNLHELLVVLRNLRVKRERYEYFEKKRKELEERLKQQRDESLERLVAENEESLEREIEKLEQLFAKIEGYVEKAHLIASSDIDKFIKESRIEFSAWLEELPIIREQITLEKDKINQFEEDILDGEFLRRLSRLTDIPVDTLKANFEKCRYVQNPNLRTKDEFIDELARLSGITDTDQIKKAKKIATDLDLDDKFQGRERSIENTRKLEQRENHGLEILLATSKQLASMPEGPEKNDLSTHYEYMLSQVSPEVFQRYLDIKAKEIDLRRAELSVTLKSVYDPEDQAKSQKRRKEIGQELAEELSLLQEDVAGVVAMAKQKLQSNPEQLRSVEETQLKIQEKASELQETFPQVLEKIQTREKTRREQAEKDMEDLNRRMAALRKPGEKPLSKLEVWKEILRYFLENNPNPSKEDLEKLRYKIEKAKVVAYDNEEDELGDGLSELNEAIKDVVKAIDLVLAEDLQESLAHLKSLTVAEEGSEVEETPAVLTPGDEELAPTPEPNKGGAPEPQQGVHRSIPTMSRIARILGITESDPQKLIKAVQEKLKGFNDAYIEQIIGTDGKKERERLTIGEDDTDEIRSKKEAYISLRVRLEGELPVPLHEVNFDDKASVDKAVDEMLATLDDEIKKAKLTEEERSAVRDFLKMRLMLGAYRSVDARDFDIAGLLESLKEQEKVHQRVSGKGPLDPEIVTAMETGARLPSKLAKRLSAQSFELQKGVRAYITQNGKPAVIINEFNKKNVLAAIAHLRHARTLECRNIPRRHRMLVETEGCRQWKQVSFDGELGPYSEHMPKNPGSWAAWYMNIEKAESGQKAKGRQSWMKGHPSTEKFIADVIDGDQATLRSFWEDVSLHGTQEMQKKIYGQMSSQQRESLKAHLNTVPSDETPLAEVRRKKQLEAFKRSANPGEPPKPPSEKQSPKPR